MTIIRMSVANCVLGLFLTGAAVLVVAPGYAQSQKVVMEEMMVPSSDPGIEIYVRNKHPADMTTFRPDRTVLYVHGATYPASTAFDLQLGGTSWMDYIAARGYDVYLLDLSGERHAHDLTVVRSANRAGVNDPEGQRNKQDDAAP